MIAKELRRRAEDAARLTRSEVRQLADQQEVQRVVHELQVHQIELEMQNESLRHAQLEAEAAQEQYQELFESAPVGYFLLDVNGVVVRVNAGGVLLLHVPRLRLIGQRLTSFVAPDDRPLLQEHLHDARPHPHATCEVRVRAANGHVLNVRVDINAAVSCESGRLVVMTDITEQKRSQDALERLNRELEDHVAARTAELGARNRQLETEIVARIESDAQRDELEARLRNSERFESLGLLAAGIAHDFNNLLVSVLGNADLLLETTDIPSNWRESLNLIKRAGRSASELTCNLLMFAGEGELRVTAVDLPDIAASTLELLRANLPAGVRVEDQLTHDLPDIAADANQIRQVVMNLVTNAAEAIVHDGCIRVRTRLESLDAAALDEFQHRRGVQPGDFVILEVQDSGPGMDAALVTRIFDPFFSTKFTGRGLGLASVLGIVQSHRAALRVHTGRGAGTRFEIAFRVSERRKERPSLPVPAPVDSEYAYSGPVLLIDDDDGVRRVLAMLLERLGFSVTDADGGKAGLELFRRTQPPFKLVVLDWLMPGFSGQQVLKALRELDATVPVLLVSGYSAQDFECYDQHVVRLQKPMTLAHLREALRQVCHRARSPMNRV